MPLKSIKKKRKSPVRSRKSGALTIKINFDSKINKIRTDFGNLIKKSSKKVENAISERDPDIILLKEGLAISDFVFKKVAQMYVSQMSYDSYLKAMDETFRDDVPSQVREFFAYQWMQSSNIIYTLMIGLYMMLAVMSKKENTKKRLK